MEDFAQVYETLNEEAPPSRTINVIRTVLAKAYELASKPLFETSLIFGEPDEEPLRVHRTTIERLLLDINRLPPSHKVYKVSSKNLEQVIEHLHIAELIVSEAPGSEHEHSVRLLIGGQLATQLRYLVDIARHGLLISSQYAVLDTLEEIPSNAKKISHIKQLLISYKQRADQYDKPFYQAIREFLKLEKKKWVLRAEESTPHFHTSRELRHFVSELIATEVEHRIHYQEGYKNFWRDEQCTLDKKEEEVQQYIHALLDPRCQEKGVQIHREPAAAGGFVDMTFTYLHLTVCMEIKKGQHQSVESAMNTQLLAYMQSAKTNSGIYLILWLKPPVGKAQSTHFASPTALASYLEQHTTSGYDIATHVIDCTKPISPSKRG